MPRSRNELSSLRVCDTPRALNFKFLNCHEQWASLRLKADASPDHPETSDGAKTASALADELNTLLPKPCWKVENPVLWDASSASVCQVGTSLLWAIFTSLRHEIQVVGCQAALQAPGSKWQQQLEGISPTQWKQELGAEQWKQLQQDAAVLVFTNPPVRVKEAAGHLFNGQKVTQQHEACMVVQQKEVFRWGLSSQ